MFSPYCYSEASEQGHFRDCVISNNLSLVLRGGSLSDVVLVLILSEKKLEALICPLHRDHPFLEGLFREVSLNYYGSILNCGVLPAHSVTEENKRTPQTLSHSVHSSQ